jgi:hypothetical protein
VTPTAIPSDENGAGLMASAAVALVIAAFLSGAVSAVLVILVAYIQAGDRARRLTVAPRSRLEVLTRAMLGVGVRTGHPASDQDGGKD